MYEKDGRMLRGRANRRIIKAVKEESKQLN